MSKGHSIKYTKMQVEFLIQNKELPRKELTEKFNATFGTAISVRSLTAKCERIGALTGRTGQFTKGQVSWNHGKKGYMGSNATSFKPGNAPHNTRPIFSERICSKDGYVFIKIREESPQFVLKHRWLWEQEYGPIPKGHKVIFKNGNKTDIRLENLMLVTNGELAVKNKMFSKISNSQTNESCILLARLKIMSNQKLTGNQS